MKQRHGHMSRQKHCPSVSIFNTTGLREIHSWITVMPRPLAFHKSQLKDCNLSRTFTKYFCKTSYKHQETKKAYYSCFPCPALAACLFQ